VLQSNGSEQKRFGNAEKKEMAERSEDIANICVLSFSFFSGVFSFFFYTSNL